MLDADLRRFVFTSTIGTIGIPAERRPATEEDEFNWPDVGGSYVLSRVEAENLVMRYARERGLPAVALCVSNTYGPGDWQPTPHGKQVALAATGHLPFYVKGWTGEVVGIEDAATALLLAAENGRNGERYIISERFTSVREVYEVAADAAGVNPPRFGVPLWAMYAMGYAGDVVRNTFRRDFQLTSRSVPDAHLADAGARQGRTRAGLAARADPLLDPQGRAVLSGQPTQ